MVPLPLFKLASLFVRHVSKYGANRIKSQAHDHPQFRAFAARYGQKIHQLNMRLNVALLRNTDAERRAKEKAEAPTVKTKEQIEKEEQLKAKYGSTTKDSNQPKSSLRPSIWKRQFKPLPEGKAVDLFADVIGDGFILLVATALILYETWRSSIKPDRNKERIEELTKQFEDLQAKERDHEEEEKRQQSRILQLEEVLRNYKDPKTKQPLLPSPTPAT
ncbi:opa3 domain protein [Diaporthe amygdali]|uniref:opa3 domain protein n=1 Tax=Phomopsis amygdali TaxID=1214568 RepID=UPI0022FECEE5|nr:opa3 domain protein [Diaporthe amygdali]KAJ0121549.1 opa3 domain protein [Diaporthe amygdali]